MRYGVLGPLTVWDSAGEAGEQVRIPETKVRALLADLLLHRGAPVAADRLVEDLWGDRPPGRPLNTLQTKISQLRRALGADRVLRRPTGYQIRLEPGELDAALFEDMVERARAVDDPRARARLLSDALALWRGPAYSDVADAVFARAEILRLDEVRLSALECRAEALLELGEHDGLGVELGELVGRNPLREGLRALHMRALYREGRQKEALESYQDIRGRLDDELGVEPGPELAALYASILRHEPDLHARGPTRRTNLPNPPTRLIGRGGEVDEVRRMLSAGPDRRLVTLTGPGGVGKTRLAIAVAQTLLDDFPDGVWLVELTALDRVSSADDIAERVITTLGLCDVAADSDPVDLVEWLCGALADKRLLLLIDNCEHVVDAVAGLAGALLAATAAARALVTSQEILDVPGEAIFPVPPLALPPGPAGAAGGDVEAIRRSSAVEFFVDRANAVLPGFAVTADNAPAVEEICRRLDGIPLALELVAARLRLLGPEEIARRLDDRFALPTGSGRGRPTRQQTLRAMIDWSWELLSEVDRTVLRRTAVNADGGTLEAVQAVCADGGITGSEVLGVLSRLVDRSLLVRDGERFRMLESVSAYCVDRLAEAGELAEVRHRFVAFHIAQVERADGLLRGRGQGGSLTLLDVETVNIRRALEIALRDGDAPSALRLVNGMAWYWLLRGRLSEARRSFRAALDLPGGAHADRVTAETWLAGLEARPVRVDVAEPALRSRLEWFLGVSLYRAGRHDEGGARVEAGLRVARSGGDRWGEAIALVERADQRLDRGNVREARADAEAGAALFLDNGDVWGRLRATRALARAAEADGDHAEAAGLLRGCLGPAEELGLWVEVVTTLLDLGRTHLAGGDPATARRMCERALRIASERSYARGEVEAGTWLGDAALRSGDRKGAEYHLRRAVRRGQALRDADGAGRPPAPGVEVHGVRALEDAPFAGFSRSDP